MILTTVKVLLTHNIYTSLDLLTYMNIYIEEIKIRSHSAIFTSLIIFRSRKTWPNTSLPQYAEENLQRRFSKTWFIFFIHLFFICKNWTFLLWDKAIYQINKTRAYKYGFYTCRWRIGNFWKGIFYKQQYKLNLYKLWIITFKSGNVK